MVGLWGKLDHELDLSATLSSNAANSEDQDSLRLREFEFGVFFFSF